MGNTPPCCKSCFSKSQIDSLRSVDNHVYAFISPSTCEAFRYNPAKNIWQGGANCGSLKNNLLSGSLKNNLLSDYLSKELIDVTASISKSRIYVLHAQKRNSGLSFGSGFGAESATATTSQIALAAVLHCFNPKTNEWIEQSSTCLPHFNSSLFVVNDRLYVAGGFTETGPLNLQPPLKCTTSEKTPGLLLCKSIFPQTVLVQWK